MPNALATSGCPRHWRALSDQAQGWPLLWPTRVLQKAHHPRISQTNPQPTVPTVWWDEPLFVRVLRYITSCKTCKRPLAHIRTLATNWQEPWTSRSSWRPSCMASWRSHSASTNYWETPARRPVNIQKWWVATEHRGVCSAYTKKNQTAVAVWARPLCRVQVLFSACAVCCLFGSIWAI